MLGLAFIAPSFAMVFLIYAANIVFQILTYVFVWQKIVDIEEYPGLLEQIMLWFSSFLALDLVLFVLIQKRELSQFFLF